MSNTATVTRGGQTYTYTEYSERFGASSARRAFAAQPASRRVAAHARHDSPIAALRRIAADPNGKAKSQASMLAELKRQGVKPSL